MRGSCSVSSEHPSTKQNVLSLGYVSRHCGHCFMAGIVEAPRFAVRGEASPVGPHHERGAREARSVLSILYGQGRETVNVGGRLQPTDLSVHCPSASCSRCRG